MIKNKKLGTGMAVFILCIFLVPLLLPSIIWAQAPGETRLIDKSNVDEIKDELPPSYYFRVKEWGHTFKIKLEDSPAHDFKPSKSYMEATKKNIGGKVKIDPKMGLINYYDHGGMPFPNPKNGVELGWNIRWYYTGDDFGYPYTMHLIDAKGRERKVKGDWHQIHWAGRTDLEPFGQLPNPKGISMKEVFWQLYPYEMKDSVVLNIRYFDAQKNDDMWIYIASMRRVRRMSTAQRCDSFVGSVNNWDDIRICNSKPYAMTYKLLGKKNIYIGKNQKDNPEYNVKSYGQSTNEVLEKWPVYILELKSKDPNYSYGNKIIYVDVETCKPIVCEMTDRKGRPWKMINMPQRMLSDRMDCVAYDVYDLQSRCASLYDLHALDIMNKNPEPEIFTIAYMKKVGR